MKSSKYDKNIVENKWQELISSDDYDGYKLQPKNLYDWLKNDNLEMFKELNEPNHDKIINEMNEITKVHSVINDKLLTKDKMLIEASIFDNNSILSCHNLLNKSCKDTCLVTRCNNHGVKIFCSNCNFSFPETWLKIQPDKAPYIYNIVVNNTTEDINNKDTYQVSQKINGYLGHSLIYIDKNIWYVYNDTNGLYEQKTDNFIGKKINKLISELKTNNNEEDWIPWIDKLNYKKNIIDELKMENELQDKEDIFDQNPYLLGFNSGVLDLKTKEHRKAKKNEFVTMKCKIEYDMDCSTDLAEKVLEDIFPNKEEREYVLNRFALCLEGINREQTFTFNYGFKASNGKSYLMRKLEEILGEYADNFPSNLITSKMKAAGESNTSLACFYKKRFMSCSEPEGNTKLNTNFIKLITGDNFKARNLFSNDVVIKPSFNIFICCNVLPSFDVYDKGISRRVRLVEFDTEFVDTPKRKGQKQIIQFTGEEELEISKGLFKLMIDKYFELSDKNFKYFEPKSLESMRKLYLNDNKDTITDILLNNYQLGDDKDFVPLKDIKKLLKSNDIVEKDALTLKKIVETTFPGTFFKSEKRVSTTKKIYNVITNMKLFSQ
jgi:P4 family phage/plasmid primase-like protien